MPISFEELPIQRPGPPYNAWGVYGRDDEFGRLNLITPEVIKAMRNKIEHSIVVNLKYVSALTLLLSAAGSI